MPSGVRHIDAGPNPVIGDFRRYPGCRLLITCAMCGWSKAYNPERVIARLQALRTGGHTTTVADVARRVQWTCPGCHRLRWRGGLVWPPGMDEREARRLANLYRN